MSPAETLTDLPEDRRRTRSVKLYGRRDLRLAEYVLPQPREDEIVARIDTDGVCMSTWKACELGSEHKKVPADLEHSPVMVGHEFSGTIEWVGKAWKDHYAPGLRFAAQVALRHGGGVKIPGYSYPHVGGAATRVILPREMMEEGCLIPVQRAGYFWGSLAEPLSCIIAAFDANYHVDPSNSSHSMGTKPGGRMALIGMAGAMGLCAVEYVLSLEQPPKKLVLADRDGARLDRAAKLVARDKASRRGVELDWVVLEGGASDVDLLKGKDPQNGFDDAFVFATAKEAVELAAAVMSRDGCINFFAGPTDKNFSARLNFYDVHYNGLHVVGTSGGNADHMRRAVEFIDSGKVDPSAMISHIGGLDSVIDTTLRMPLIGGWKKMIYPHVDLPLTALSELRGQAARDPRFGELALRVEEHGGCWNDEAEDVLLRHWRRTEA